MCFVWMVRDSLCGFTREIRGLWQ
ncbi:TPA: hypothetical protein ACHK0X_005168 [Escherichia coli]|nr:hypothetical protein [Escherichia coli]MCF4024263.1 hypothetical protein [Escherichia coli]MCF4054698.1 hypothetical protein [Escherichia coli]MCF4077009.1 hypothetical protein [Escherichia coli]MCF4091811.1 hypothetical protein [Escherichia coli]MCF4110991.1 hypothetical protein [Escherichia coli]